MHQCSVYISDQAAQSEDELSARWMKTLRKPYMFSISPCGADALHHRMRPCLLAWSGESLHLFPISGVQDKMVSMWWTRQWPLAATSQGSESFLLAVPSMASWTTRWELQYDEGTTTWLRNMLFLVLGQRACGHWAAPLVQSELCARAQWWCWRWRGVCCFSLVQPITFSPASHLPVISWHPPHTVCDSKSTLSNPVS